MKEELIKLITEIEILSKEVKKDLLDSVKQDQKESLTDNCKKLSIINELACQLAEKEICDKYDKRTNELCKEEGEYFEVYQDEFDALYDHYWHQLSQLSNHK